MSEYPELDRLVSGIRQRDNAAFAELYRLVAGSLATFANSMIRDRTTAEDAVQQAFLELARSAHTITGDGRTLRAWLFRSVRYTCLDEIRRRTRRPETPYASIPDTATIDEPDTVGWDPAIERALQQLSDRDRTLIVLRHVVGLSGQEIADVMELKRPAAYAATSRAEHHFKTALADVESAVPPAFQPLHTRKPS